ncbi:MAG: hypothetical protein OXU19_10215 [bacterium]|nr:hypothetical protein [bacterium]MDE0239309.1 hypothetical protein [bacterium]MDE0415537.1 hypothetical protein [bacterium]
MLDEAHRRRNLAEYEGAIEVNEALVAAVIRVTEELASRTEAAGDGSAM